MKLDEDYEIPAMFYLYLALIFVVAGFGIRF